jgi:cytochrome b involved in lipid metabolism
MIISILKNSVFKFYINNIMKKSVTITLFIFWAVVTAILTAALITRSNCKNSSINNTPANISNSNSANLADVTLDLKTIAIHNSGSDCWMIIDNKVYDVTSAISSHPGGAETILPYCGKDGTKDFATKDRQPARPHSGFAYTSLTDYLIGNLNQKLTGQQYQDSVNQVNSNAQNAVNQSRGREDD